MHFCACVDSSVGDRNLDLIETLGKQGLLDLFLLFTIVLFCKMVDYRRDFMRVER